MLSIKLQQNTRDMQNLSAENSMQEQYSGVLKCPKPSITNSIGRACQAIYRDVPLEAWFSEQEQRRQASNNMWKIST